MRKLFIIISMMLICFIILSCDSKSAQYNKEIKNIENKIANYEEKIDSGIFVEKNGESLVLYFEEIIILYEDTSSLYLKPLSKRQCKIVKKQIKRIEVILDYIKARW